MEVAVHDLLRTLGLSVMQAVDDYHISWPRVAASCDYKRPARFDELITIEVSVERLGEKSVTFAFRFLREDVLLATGSMTAVCCRMERGHPPKSIPIPPDILQKLASVK
jgi:4-hydroxybenzoyl-CoA thioesterase/acyl-CoA thioester hydrolase